MKIEPTMYRQIVDCMDQLLDVYKFNLKAADCTPFNGSIISCALSYKIDQLKSLRQLFINIYNSKSEEKEVRNVRLVCDRCGDEFILNVLFDRNGVSINKINTPLLCSKCIVELKNE